MEDDGKRLIHRWEHMGSDLTMREGERSYTVAEFLEAAVEPQVAKQKLRNLLDHADGE